MIHTDKCYYESESRSVMTDSLQLHGLYSPWNSPGQNTRVGSLSLLQGIFPTQESNPCLPHCRWIIYQLSHKGSPGIPEWVAYPFSSRSSRPRNQTGVSCIAGRFFYQLSYQRSQCYTGSVHLPPVQHPSWNSLKSAYPPVNILPPFSW